MRKMLRRGWVSSDPSVKALLADGEEAFMERVRDRVLREHSGEVFLNHCRAAGRWRGHHGRSSAGRASSPGTAMPNKRMHRRGHDRCHVNQWGRAAGDARR
jgi:hypothetical protein